MVLRFEMEYELFHTSTVYTCGVRQQNSNPDEQLDCVSTEDYVTATFTFTECVKKMARDLWEGSA